ncbi:MFS transporter [Streptomyces albidoflavus]|uniref:MFS transporter n=1 Tax=Streptomyces TaxID=1883 RepID=UPI00063E8E0F|nr:MFS transporter [Streptomyces sp. KE1]KLI99197.1 hypothetical protein WQ59_18595 [Streptomyces sp. KE1]
MLIAIFKYVNRHFEPRLSSTIYLIGFQMATQVGAAVISPLAGLGYDRLGYAPTYLVMSALVAAFTLVSVFTLRADAKGTHGLPAWALPRTAPRQRSDRSTLAARPTERRAAAYHPERTFL